MELMIERLSKRYGQHWALRELSLRCEPGMLGLVGPNGAGKTSLMRMIATLLEPTEGTISWNGQDICLMILQEGRVLADTTPEALLAQTAGSVWSVTTDQATALWLQTTCQVSTMVNQMHGVTLRIVSATRPHEAAVVIDPSLEEAYLLATGRQNVLV